MITVHGRKGKKARCFWKAGGGMASSSAVQPLKVVTARARAERIPFGCPRRTGQVGFFFLKDHLRLY
jgi:hypothetical protein